ncbi:MAG: HAD-IIIA family hydrolase, partial [Hyphomonadaceae bacterium]
MPAAPRPALFLDRDGVINVDRSNVYRVEDFAWVEGARETIARFNAMDWLVFIVTNQSGIARGFYTEEQMQTLHDWMTNEFANAGARIDRIYHCPFHENGTIERYRKDSFDR